MVTVTRVMLLPLPDMWVITAAKPPLSVFHVGLPLTLSTIEIRSRRASESEPPAFTTIVAPCSNNAETFRVKLQEQTKTKKETYDDNR